MQVMNSCTDLGVAVHELMVLARVGADIVLQDAGI